MKDLNQSLCDSTTAALAYHNTTGCYPGSARAYRQEVLNDFDKFGLRHDLNLAAVSGKNSCYMMTIEKGHQSNTNLFDPLEHPPSGIRWPLKEMLTSLKVRAKAVADWAQENGLTVTISFVTKYDPYRRENAHEYMLVLSWRPKEKPAEDAA